MNRLTPWDCWVLVCFVYTVIGYGIVGWIVFHPGDATPGGFLATFACFVWALGGLVYAERDDSWLVRA